MDRHILFIWSCAWKALQDAGLLGARFRLNECSSAGRHNFMLLVDFKACYYDDFKRACAKGGIKIFAFLIAQSFKSLLPANVTFFFEGDHSREKHIEHLRRMQQILKASSKFVTAAEASGAHPTLSTLKQLTSMRKSNTIMDSWDFLLLAEILKSMGFRVEQTTFEAEVTLAKHYHTLRTLHPEMCIAALTKDSDLLFTRHIDILWRVVRTKREVVVQVVERQNIMQLLVPRLLCINEDMDFRITEEHLVALGIAGGNDYTKRPLGWTLKYLVGFFFKHKERLQGKDCAGMLEYLSEKHNVDMRFVARGFI